MIEARRSSIGGSCAQGPPATVDDATTPPLRLVRLPSALRGSSEHSGPPDRIGRYALVRRLAVGGMAELFLARVQGLEGFEKVVVLKRILPHLAQDEDFVRMFLTEARLAATLDHPNIVHVRDIGRDGDEYFFTMEYLHGEDLRRVLDDATGQGVRLPLRHALSIVSQVASGLHFAHEQVGFDGKPLGIIHRDVSPSNILLLYSGGVKLVDFGIAKAAGPTHASRLSSLKGKARYMSPEQCRARPLDRRSDVFSIGLLLYELSTGVPAFRGDNELDILHRVARADVPDPCEVWPLCPPDLAEVIRRATALEPADRYPSAQALQLHLEGIAEHRGGLTSNAALGRFLHERFGARPLPWLDAGAQADPGAEQAAPAAPVERTAPTRVKAARVVTVVAPEGSAGGTVAAPRGPLAIPGPAARSADATPSDSHRPRRWRSWVVAGATLGAAALVAWVAMPSSEPAPGAAARPVAPSATDHETTRPGSPATQAPAAAQGPAPASARDDASEHVGASPPQSSSDAAMGAGGDPPEPSVPAAEPPAPETSTLADAAAPVEPPPERPTSAARRQGKGRTTSSARTAPPKAEDTVPPDVPLDPPATSEPSAPRHTRPELPANDDPDALLPY